MASFRRARELLLLAYANNIINDEEFLLLYDVNRPKNLVLPYDSYPPFDFNTSVNEAECKSEFRFEKGDIYRLSDALQLPDQFVCRQGSVSDKIEGLCMLLRRLAYPCRYSDLVSRFARPVPVICMITNCVLDHIYEHHGHRVTQWNNTILHAAALQSYSDAIADKGATLTNCVGFIDGTVRPVSKPGEHQRIIYNGHKRVHALKFQAVALPNGLIGNLYGPVEGKRHDAAMLADSGLLRDLEQYAISPTGEPFCLYGDPAYPLRVQLMGPFRNAVLTPDMAAFNVSMSSVRIAVEWLFGDVINYFKFLDFKKNLKLGLSSIGKFYVVSALLRNALTCLYGNTTSNYFGLDPPTIEEYFS